MPTLQPGGNGGEILVAASGEVHHHQMVLRFARREIHHPRQGMRRLERGDDSLEARAELERRQRQVVFVLLDGYKGRASGWRNCRPRLLRFASAP